MLKVSRLEKEWAARILYTLVTDNVQRLERGIQLRNRMVEDIKAGKPATGYRATWIRASAQRVVKLLGEIAAEFNDFHSTDMCSSLDYLDILATAGQLAKQSTPKEATSIAKIPEPPPKFQA